MVEKGVDIPLVGVMPFPMRDKLYKQVRDLVLGKSAMVGETTAVESKFTEGELVRDILSKKVYRVFKTDMVALKLAGDPDDTAPINLHESCIEKV